MTGKHHRAVKAKDGAVCAGAKLAYRIAEFAAAAGIGRSLIYEAISDGRLRARKLGKITLIDADEGKRFIASLPFIEPAAASARGGDDSDKGEPAAAVG